MKSSIAYLPVDKQKKLNFLVNEVLKRLPQTEYIILYGSYARDNYVRRGIRVEPDGVPAIKISDYDLLVLTSGINAKKTETVLDNVEGISSEYSGREAAFYAFKSCLCGCKI